MNTLERRAMLEQLIDTYCSAWNEPDPKRRDEIIRVVWNEAGTYIDPTAKLVGRKELSDHIGIVLAQYVGARVIRTSTIDAHHGMLRFAWKMTLPDGKSLPEGIDFGEIASDGRLQRIVGFFGSLAQREQRSP